MALSESRGQSDERLAAAHPRMLRHGEASDPQKLGEVALEALLDATKREIGQCLEWAIERVHTTKTAVATDLKYTDPGVISRWTTGTERLQLDKLKVLAPAVYRELLIALLKIEGGVHVKTVVELERVG